jgi:hypothetical protein
MKNQQVYSFSWNTELYSSPPVATQADLNVSEEEVARVEEICMDAARRRLAGENFVRIERVLTGVEVGEIVAVAAPDDVNEPFYIAQVT